MTAITAPIPPEDMVLLPCEMCDELISFDKFAVHQLICTTGRPAKRICLEIVEALSAKYANDQETNPEDSDELLARALQWSELVIAQWALPSKEVCFSLTFFSLVFKICMVVWPTFQVKASLT